MSTAQLNPLHIPMNDSPPSHPHPLEPTKACVTLTSPTKLVALVGEQFSLQDGAAQTFVVDFAALGVGAKDDRMSSSVGEHWSDGTHFPPSPHNLPEKDPLPPFAVHSDAHTSPAGAPPTSDGSECAGIDTPTEPPGLPRPVDDAPADGALGKADEEGLSAVEDEHAGDTVSTCFALSGLEILRTFIPDDLFPNDLLVYDPDNLTHLHIDKSQSSSDIPVRYVRIFPQVSCERSTSQEPTCAGQSPGDRPVRVAHVYLKEDNKLGGGHHGSAYSAPFRLRLDAELDEESTVRVAMKTADTRCGPYEMLRREAVAYNAFPRHLAVMEDTYTTMSPPSVGVATAVPDSDGVAAPVTEPAAGPDAISTSTSTVTPNDASTDGADKQCTHTTEYLPAVVPKFFGYYAPVDADGNVIEHSHPDCDIDGNCAVTWPTRLLLIEECGEPIVLENGPLDSERPRCLELFKRLHVAGFIQGSVYSRNILVQPGPLSALPEERSPGTPSFRVIDFGRMKMLSEFSSESEQSFEQAIDVEDDCAFMVLVDLEEDCCVIM